MSDAQRRAAIDHLWNMGDLSWKLRPEQAMFKARVEETSTQLFVGNISRRWGKSFTMVTYCIEQCLKNPNERIHYGAAFQTDLTKFILPAFHIILQDCPDELRPRYKASTKTWQSS
jgi:predicted P-loop ATPase